MANNRPSIIVNEDDKCINLIAKDGFSQNASFLDKIRETLETDSYKQINLFLAPSADSDLSNALFSIRLKAITSELKKVDIATHDHSIFRQRISGSVRDGYEVVMETLPHDPSNWREAFAKMLKQLKSYGWEIFKGKGAFDLDKAIKDVENLLKK